MGILGIGEGPGENEDQQGIAFVGEAGQLFDRYLAQYGLSLHRDFYLINAVNCRPPNNRTPTATEIACCRGRVQQAIRKIQPRFIWLLGESAVRSFYAGRFSELGIGRWRGLCIPDKTTGAWVVPLYHPSFALRSGNDQNKLSIFDRDFFNAVSFLEYDPPVFTDFEQYIDRLTNYPDIERFLQNLIDVANTQPISIAIDWETSHLKPYYIAFGGQRIWTAAIATSLDYCAAFPVMLPGIHTEGEQRRVMQLLVAVLQHPNIHMAAHNLQFEHVWAKAVLGAVPQSWAWCTMNAAHVIDVRKDFCGLKFQAYINYGVDEYGAEAKKYMKVGTSGLNALPNMPLKNLLTYNGMDAIITMWLWADQYKTLTENPHLLKGYQFFHEGLQALADATHRGIPMDEIYYVEQRHSLTERMESLERRLLRGPVAKEFKQRTGHELNIVNKDFSAKDLRVVLYDIIGLRATKQTGSGLDSVDKEVMTDIEHPWVKNLLEWRKLYKIANTYVAQFVREIANGRMNPWFPLHTTRSTRGSSQGPNFQNVPKRDKESKRITRRGVTAETGCHLGAVDYGSQEVRTAAILSGDTALIAYCHEPDSDMHMDVAERLWYLGREWITGDIRFHSKGGFVFAEFYGSYFVNCALSLWDECIATPTKLGGMDEPITLREHLENTGIITTDRQSVTKIKMHGHVETVTRQQADFINHVKGVEDWFWEKFAGLREWQERMVVEYQRTGYVEMPFGFRRGGLLNRNKIFNTAIQGTAFHFLLWAYIQTKRHADKHWRSYQLGQIHDEMVINIYPDELNNVLNTTVDIMENQIRAAFDWINVPLVAEPELSPVNGNWTEMKDIVYVMQTDTTGAWEWKQ